MCILIGMSSCSRKSFYVIDGAPVDISFVDENELNISEKSRDHFSLKTAFVGDAINYTIFQLDFNNNSSDSILLSADGIYLVDYNTAEKIYPIDKYDEIDYLESEKDEINKEKNRRTINDALLGGINLLSIFGGGGGLVNAIGGLSYGAETSYYILESRRDFNFIKGTVEDEINYIYDWVLYEENVPAQDTISIDILFPRRPEMREARLVINIEGEELEFLFQFALKEIRQ